MKRWILSMLALWTLLFANAQEKIVACEYWLDGEQDKAVSIPMSGDEVAFSLDASNLKAGVHTLYYRVKNEQGQYSTPLTWLFIKHYVCDTTLSRIKAVEYWLDGDMSRIQQVDVASDSVSFAVDASDLKPGTHTLTMRVSNEGEAKSTPLTWLFFKDYTRATHICWYKYWWNTHQDKGERVMTESKEEDYVFFQRLEVPDYAKVEADTVLKTANFYIQFGNNAGYTTAIDTVKVPITGFSPVDEQGIVYTLNEAMDAFEVIGYTDALVADVEIPEKLYNLPVNAMQDNALADAEALKSIMIPSSIVSVGNGVFSGCRNLLVVDWGTSMPLQGKCFDSPEEHGNLLVFANDRGDFTGNVVTNGVAESITLVDGLPFRNPREFLAKRISYTRDFTKKTKIGTAAGWESVVLPFDVQHIQHGEKGELAPFGVSDFLSTLPFWLAEWNLEEEGFVHSRAIKANNPFIMAVPNSNEYDNRFNIEGFLTFTAKDAMVYPTTVNNLPVNAGFCLSGSYEGEIASSYVYALNDEEYTTDDGVTYMPGGVYVADLRDIRPFESYVYNAQVVRSRYLPINPEGSTTGIDRLLLKDASQSPYVDVYTLQGIMLKHQVPINELKNEFPKGIYIINNKKIIIK